MGLEEIRRLKENAKKPKEKKAYIIPKKSAKRIEKEKLSIPKKAALNRWFEDRRKEMKGVCMHCGSKTLPKNDTYYKFSIAHILPKRLFKSVETHPLNWIELCYFENSCHANFDNNTLDMIDLNCFDVVIERFCAMYPEIDPKERKYIPDILPQYLEVEK